MTTVEIGTQIVDGDGHVLEDAQGIREYLPQDWLHTHIARLFGFWPQLSHLHLGLYTTDSRTFNDPGPGGWKAFLDGTGFKASVLYPTWMLAVGRIVDTELAVGVTRAYNNWLFKTYLEADSRLKGVALLPMQDPEAAVKELRRATTELGMCAAMLPATGLKGLLGDKEYWPVYEEANRLGCAITVHGGAHFGMGFDHMNFPAASHALGHPVSIMIQFVSMLFNGVFDKFPNARFGFLEGGVGWFLTAIERCHGSYSAMPPYDPDHKYMNMRQGEKMSGYIQRHIDEGRVFVGVEGDEPTLAAAVKLVGPKPFVFSSDFPHEVTVDSIQEEIEELMEVRDIDETDKQAILRSNAERLYNLA